MKKIIIFVIIFILVGVGFWYAKIQVYKEIQEEVIQYIPEEIKQALHDQEPVMQQDPQMPEIVGLLPVEGYVGNGAATRLWSNGIFSHSIIATLDNPGSDFFYEGWLITEDPELNFFSTGSLRIIGNVYELDYSSNENRSRYYQVVITKETMANGLDGIPEEHVLEGDFSR